MLPSGARVELRPNEEESQGELFKAAWGSLSKHPKAPPAAGKSSGKKKAPPRKKRKDKAAPSRVGRKAWGSLAQPSTSSGRRLQVSREVLEADGTSLGLFTQKDSLSTRASRNLTSQLNTAPQYEEAAFCQNEEECTMKCLSFR